jgi:hypothetical protein
MTRSRRGLQHRPPVSPPRASGHRVTYARERSADYTSGRPDADERKQGAADPAAADDPVDPADPAARVDPTAPVDPAAAVDPADPAAPIDPTASVDPAAAVDPADPAAPIDPTAPVDLATAVDALAAQPIDELDEPQIRGQLAEVDAAMRRLDARRCRLAAALVERQRRRAKEADPDDARAGDRAERQVQRELADQLQWSTSDAKRATKVGRQANTAPHVGDALDSGKLSPRHAAVLADTLRWLEGEARDRAEETLLAAAAKQDPVAFGRTCRRLLAEFDHDAATSAESRRHARRQARTWQTDDGMVGFSGQLSGIAGETFLTAIHAFRRPDAPDEHRTAEQATADAFAEAAAAALRSEEAPRRHGIPAQVVVTIDQPTLDASRGVAEARWSGPLPLSEAALVVDDSQVAGLVLDARGLPTEASVGVRTVPVALHRGLVQRDGGCIYVGCDTPANWCQVMHLETPFRLEGRLSFDNAALGCVHHHRQFDAGRLHLTWREGRPSLQHPERPPPHPP